MNDAREVHKPEATRTSGASALVQDGYKLLHARRTNEACDRWLPAWEPVKKRATPDMRTVEAFDKVYKGLPEQVFNWYQELE